MAACSGRQAFAAGVAAVLIAAISAPDLVHSLQGSASASAAPDYCPAGMPDFSQCRGAWSMVGSPSQWTHAGPVSAADALWWLYSVAERAPAAPPVVSDSHALVTAYPRFGEPRDDHATENLGPLVEDLALRCDTNGTRSGEKRRGTTRSDLAAGLRTYLDGRRKAAPYDLEVIDRPSVDWLVDRIASGAAVIAALGVWEQRADGWLRIGGHYAAIAGVEGLAVSRASIVLSDPLADSAAFGGAGWSSPEDPRVHGCREAPRAHDDAAAVSHDRYDLMPDDRLPGEPTVLATYFTADTYRDAAAFAGQNLDDTAPVALVWSGGAVVMALDGALAVMPGHEGRPSSTSPAATATATPPFTGTPARQPTATLIGTATGGPTGAADTPTVGVGTRLGHALLPLVISRR